MWQRVWSGSRRDEQLVLVICLAVLSYCAGINHARSRTTQPLPPVFVDAPSLPGQHQGAGGGQSRTSRIVVHVCGAVRKSGVYTLPRAARIMDAVQSAGGATKDGASDALNLAALVVDGQQIRVPTRREARLAAMTAMPTVALGQNAAGSHAKSKKAPNSPVNINKASAAELQALPGIGPALAQRIIEYRQQQGAFKTLSDLDAVKGVGPKKLEKLSPYIRF